MTDTVAFDPGLGHLATDLYSEVYIIENDMANMPQYSRKARYYSITHKKIIKAMLNNLAFYKGCLGWAYYICNAHQDAVLTSNPFISLNEEQKAQYAPTEMVDFFIEYLNKYNSDLKYYHIKSGTLPDDTQQILNQYREFVSLNEGFINAFNVKDIKLPENLTFNSDLELMKSKIDDAIAKSDLSELLNL